MALMMKDVLEADYVQIPNETAKAVEAKNNNSPISLEALGLITNLWSYDIKKWEVRKTELYKRFGQNKKTSVMNAWDDLVKNRYIIEFKYRNGRKWEYVYIYRIKPYSEVEIEQKLAECVELAGVSSTSDFVNLKMNSSKCASQNQKVINNRLKQDKRKKDKPKKEKVLNPNIENNPKIDIDDDEKEPFEINNFAFKEFKKEFNSNFENMFDDEFYKRIYAYMIELELDFITYPESVEQLEYMIKQKEKGLLIADSAKYFVGGIKLRRTSRHAAMTKVNLRKAETVLKERKEKQEQSQTNRVPLYNWLEQEE